MNKFLVIQTPAYLMCWIVAWIRFNSGFPRKEDLTDLKDLLNLLLNQFKYPPGRSALDRRDPNLPIG